MFRLDFRRRQTEKGREYVSKLEAQKQLKEWFQFPYPRQMHGYRISRLVGEFSINGKATPKYFRIDMRPIHAEANYELYKSCTLAYILLENCERIQ